MARNYLISRKLNKKIKNVERQYGDYISYVLHANFTGDEHIMLVEEQEEYHQVYKAIKDELAPLEKADLIDLQKVGGYDRPNKTRRNLLC